MDTTATTENLKSQTLAFQLKGSLFTLTVLQLLTTDAQSISDQMANQVQRSPAFFKNAPIIIELQKVSKASQNINFSLLAQKLRDFGLIPVGVRGGNPDQHKQAADANLAILANTKINVPDSSKADAANALARSRIITQPVRSGQQIYAKGGDLIIAAPVSAGAEVLADGNIHIYGPLRGRALAGINGDKEARIFCRSLEAELVSIAGHYWVSEDLKVPLDHTGVQIYLQDEHLHLGLL